MGKIKLSDTFIDVASKMSNGNPGALNVLMDLMQPITNEIDPDNIMGWMGNILSLDTIGIYGGDIYVLMNDICENNVVKFVTILRSHQLGFLDGNVIRDACSRQDYSGKKMIDIIDLHKKVKKQLPSFSDLVRN